MIEKAKRPTKAIKAAAETVPAAMVTPDTAVTEIKVVKAAKIPRVAPKIPTVAPIIPSVKAVKGEKHKKQKMVRDSFTMPESDYAHIAALKERCIKAGVSAKKSEVLRAALTCLSKLSDKALTKAITDLEVIKTGRPVKN